MNEVGKKTRREIVNPILRQRGQGEEVGSLIKKIFDIEADGRGDFYKLRRWWAVYLAIVNAFVVIAAYCGVLLAGFGVADFSNTEVKWLIVAGTLENGVVLGVTWYLFSDRPPLLESI